MLDRFGGREKVIRFLTAAVVIGVGVWIVAEATYNIAFFGVVQNTVPSISNWLTWTEIVSRIAYDLWLGALALLLLLWLSQRLVDSPPPRGRD